MLASFALEVKHAYIYIRGEMARRRVPDRRRRRPTRRASSGWTSSGPAWTSSRSTAARGAHLRRDGPHPSLEGKRGHPRIKPPLPCRASGSCPTVVSNVETLCCVKHIIVDRGADGSRASAAARRTPGQRSTPFPAMSRSPASTRLRSASVGAAPRDGRRRARGGRKLRPSSRRLVGAVLTAAEGREGMPMDFDGIAAAKSMFGSAAIIVMDETRTSEGRHEHREVLRARVLRPVHAVPGAPTAPQDAQARRGRRGERRATSTS